MTPEHFCLLQDSSPNQLPTKPNIQYGDWSSRQIPPSCLVFSTPDLTVTINHLDPLQTEYRDRDRENYQDPGHALSSTAAW